MEGRHDDLIEDFSHGMRKKTQLISALLLRRPVTVIDETLNGVDIEALHLGEVQLAGLRDQGMAVLLCTHDFALLERLADRILFLDLGQLIVAADTGSLVREHGSLAAMVFAHLARGPAVTMRPYPMTLLVRMLLLFFTRRVLSLGVLRSATVRWLAAGGCAALTATCTVAAYRFLDTAAQGSGVWTLLFRLVTVSVVVWVQFQLAVPGVVGSVVVHEWGHVAALRRVSTVTHVRLERTAWRTSVIPVGVISGGAAAAVALAGPGVCVVLAALLLLLWPASPVGWCFAVHGAFLLPVFGDGRALARVMRSRLRERNRGHRD